MMRTMSEKFSALEPQIESEAVKAGSDRSFGLVFATVFAVYGGWPLWSGSAPRYWAIAIACAFLAAAVFLPWTLRPLNALWLKFGALLHRVVTPVVMGVVFFATVVPTGLIMRALGKDPLRLKRDREATSYWIERQPPGPDPQTMIRQF